MSQTIAVRPPAYRRLSKRVVVLVAAIVFAIATVTVVLLFLAAIDDSGASQTPAPPAETDDATNPGIVPPLCGPITSPPTPC